MRSDEGEPCLKASSQRLSPSRRLPHLIYEGEKLGCKRDFQVADLLAGSKTVNLPVSQCSYKIELFVVFIIR